MIALQIELQEPVCNRLTFCGLPIVELHDKLWASHGLVVVRRGDEVPETSQPYLLLEKDSLVIFDASSAVSHLIQRQMTVVVVRLRGQIVTNYGERIVSRSNGEFLRFERRYRPDRKNCGRCYLTSDRAIAARWASTIEPAESVGRTILRRSVISADGHFYDASEPMEVAGFAHAAPRNWTRPDLALSGMVRLENDIWLEDRSEIPSSAFLAGPLWIGRGVTIGAEAILVGPGVMWDSSGGGASPDPLEGILTRVARADRTALGKEVRLGRYQVGKRAFDVAFAVLALLMTVPLYPLIMLAIWFEDGGPFFYGHKREGLGGREFSCWKFRSMRRDADRVKAEMRDCNEADGPQFYMTNDPRVTWVGRFLRKFNIDELPQFLNVLWGQMSVVGPRPSPHHENQCCPAWREARLSVRPGITGLWQVMRTRNPGTDFQEWVRYDIEYAERANWRLDAYIFIRTLKGLFQKKGKR